MSLLLSCAASPLLSYGGVFGAETMLDRYVPPSSGAVEQIDIQALNKDLAVEEYEEGFWVA